MHSPRALRTHLSAKQFARGVCGGVFAIVRPWLVKDRVEDAGEPGVTVPDQEAEGADPVTEVHGQVAGLLGRPFAVRMSGHAQDVNRRVRTSMTNSA